MEMFKCAGGCLKKLVSQGRNFAKDKICESIILGMGSLIFLHFANLAKTREITRFYSFEVIHISF